MGRTQINPIPEGAEGGACSRCKTTKPATSFYFRKNGSRNPWCKDCYRADMKQKAAAGAFKTTRPAAADCGKCGEVFQPRVNDGQLHCAPCEKEIYAFKVMLRGALGKADRVAKAWSKPPKTCPHCGAEFRTVQTKAAYCSPACSQAAHNATRKAQWKVRDGGVVVERVSRAYIVQRDKATCHLCGKKCREEEIHLDHLVPLSRGGDHSAANLRVACATCNLSKRADARGEQLLLIG